MESLSLAYTFIVVGLLLLVAEVFVPSGGLLFVMALCSLVAGVAMVFVQDTPLGWLTLVGVFIAAPITWGVMFHYWPKTRMGRRFMLERSDDDDTVASMPVILELEQLRGKVGRAISPLRPSGVVDFDGRRIDVMSEGMLIEPDEWVRCIDVRAGRVLVRPIGKPDVKKLEDLDLG